MEKDCGKAIAALAMDLDRDRFLRLLIRELSGTLEEVVGLEDAEGFISVVGRSIGAHLDRSYRLALETSKLTAEQVSSVLVDLKQRIGGEFFVIEQGPTRIVFGSQTCPFGSSVVGRPSMCMMTSNVFGSIAAENLGYARVELQETIARGAAGCRVVVHLAVGDPAASSGQEYFADPE